MNICDFIDAFSKKAFTFLTDVYSHKLSYSELGLTDSLVYNLTKFVKTNSLNIDVLKITSNIECVFGNDIDIFIQNSFGKYDWLVFQAKVLGWNGAYNDLKSKDQIPQQWEKLKLHEIIYGSKSFYLLYSGQPKIKTKCISGISVKSDCKGKVNYNEIGLGVVETDTISWIRSTKTKGGLLYLNELFPKEISSFRSIFCCDNNITTYRSYNKNELYNFKIYDKVLLSELTKQYLKESNNDNYFDELTNYASGRTRIIINK